MWKTWGVIAMIVSMGMIIGCGEEGSSTTTGGGTETGVETGLETGELPDPTGGETGNECTPTCVDKQCGSDGCAGTCGVCDASSTCNAAGQCVQKCQVDCTGKQCGDNGCGGSCGQCPTGICSETGTCVCVPHCGGKECGADGCGGACGTCASGLACNAVGQCVGGAECTDTCNSVDAQCGAVCGVNCGACAEGLSCVGNQCVCEPACDGKTCGDDGCGGSCGTCEVDSTCSDVGQCVPCEYNCQDKQCGSDGCGGSCGLCGIGESCSDAGLCESSSCCFSSENPGCGNTAIEECVCGLNPNCCAADGAWDDLCVMASVLVCGASCNEDPDPATCEGFCGAQSPEGCWCDEQCAELGNCCDDVCTTCGFCDTETGGGEIDPESCEGVCGSQAAGGCWCDAGCVTAGDCCADACAECDSCGAEELSCVGKCGDFNVEWPCQCDDACLANNDCCEDACTECGETTPDVCAPDVPPVTSCEGICGEAETNGCACSEACVAAGNCCDDYEELCVDAGDPNSCVGSCDGPAPGDCYCDLACLNFDDCCADACSECGYCDEEPVLDTCEGNCDGEAASGCSCAADCYDAGTCCDDVEAICGYSEPVLDSCVGSCGDQAPSGCFCDEACVNFGDCCDDACSECGQCPEEDSCLGKCGEPFVEGAVCQCDELCVASGDCCADACFECGLCEEEVSLCDAPEAACAEGDVEPAPCGFCGYKLRTCTADCTWGAWGECTGGGQCVAGTQKPCENACGTQTCLNTCEWGGCGYNYDAYEYNNSKALAEDLGEYTEDEDIPSVIGAFLHTGSPVEVDWYKMKIKEGGSWVDWSLEFKVTLSGGSGIRTLCMFYDEDSDGTTQLEGCVSGSGDLILATGDIDSVGTADKGTIHVKVEAELGSCSDYSLDFKLN